MADSRDLHDLWGGACRAVIPPEFIDISKFRAVPDNQEVFAHAESDRSIIFEVLEKESCEDDHICKHYFDDLAQANGAFSSSDIFYNQPLTAAECPLLAAAAAAGQSATAYASAGFQQVAKFKEGEESANKVLIYICILRLHSVSADLAIHMNVPVELSQTSSSARWFTSVDETAQGSSGVSFDEFVQIVKSFEVVNWGLFGE